MRLLWSGVVVMLGLLLVASAAEARPASALEEHIDLYDDDALMNDLDVLLEAVANDAASSAPSHGSDSEEDSDSDNEAENDDDEEDSSSAEHLAPASSAGASAKTAAAATSTAGNAALQTQDHEQEKNEEDDDEEEDDDGEHEDEGNAITNGVAAVKGAHATSEPGAFLSVSASSNAERRRRRGSLSARRRRLRRKMRRCRRRCHRRCGRRHRRNATKRQACRRRCNQRCNKRARRRVARRRRVANGMNMLQRREKIARMQARNARFRSRLGTAVQKYAARQTRKLIKWFITTYLNHASVRKHAVKGNRLVDRFAPEPGPTPSDPESPQTDGRRRRKRGSKKRRGGKSTVRYPGLVQSANRPN